MSLVAVVTAAGASTRMGRPKARLVWRGVSFVRHAVAQAEAAGVTACVVVQGATPLHDLDLGPARLVDNPGWEDGPLSTLQAGLAALAPAPDTGVVVLTVDRPHVRPQTVRALAACFADEPTRLWQPQYRGAHGHPIVYPADLAARLRALPPGASAREVVHAPDVRPRRAFMDTDDAAVVDNIDRPEDWARLP